MEQYDLIVIGGGPTGYNSAEYAAKKGLKVLLAEQGALGGTCLNAGCIPTKAFLYAAKISKAFPHESVVDKKDELVKVLVKGVEARLRKNKIKVVKGTASIGRSEQGIQVIVDGEIYGGKQLLLATGSSPVIPPIEGVREGIKEGWVITSNEILELRELPKHLVIVGAGVIGFEMAAYFQAAGTQVTIVEMLDKVLGSCDREVSSLMQQKMERKGVKIHLTASVTKVTKEALSFTEGDEEKEIKCDKVLMAVGRKANILIEGIDTMGIAVDQGVITVDERCKTNVTNVYAAGDVIGKITLAHAGYREGEVAVNNMVGEKDNMDYRAISSVVYTNPEAAFVGLNEEEAIQAGYSCEVKKVSINFSGRHVIEQGMDDGICKLVIDQKKGIIIGAAVMSAYASEYIYALALMIQNKIPVNSVRKTVFPHPTVGEIIREALMD